MRLVSSNKRKPCSSKVTYGSRNPYAHAAFNALQIAREAITDAYLLLAESQASIDTYVGLIGGAPGTMTSTRPTASQQAPTPDRRREQDGYSERERRLGQDPATGRFRPAEAQTARRIEDARRIELMRSPKPSGPDWVGPDGTTYDAVGNFPAKYFDRQWGQLRVRIVDHLRKADYVPVDVSQFTPEQAAWVKEFIGPLGPRVFIVGM
ncbi:hypothetical protein [Actinokineospora sp.]|uniref:hypothetical protein n=1 Tax=Actinokineospora sp. TaxID=1872133 RepID=UPI0040375F09